MAAVSASGARDGGIYTDGDLSGCGRPANLSSSLPHLLTSSGMVRSYTVHLPANYAATQQYPVLVGYHGHPGIGLFLEVDARLDEFAPDKIVVYPDGVEQGWAGANYSRATVPQDLQFTADLLADLRARYCVDSARVYATGMSNGAGFVDVLACNDTVGGEFAAFAPVAGAYYTNAHGPNDGCKPARDLTPILEFHGGADASVHYDGGEGEGGYEPPYCGLRNGCQTPPEQQDSFNDTVHHQTWTCRGVQGVLQHYKVDPMKHDWPSTEPNFSQVAAGDVPTHIQASEIMQAFFRNYTRPSAPGSKGNSSSREPRSSSGGAHRLDTTKLAVIGAVTGAALVAHLV
ncbi:Alpha/Beta hydrolase protein [Apiospora kogelbergensis]|uniref:Alpha/Beta hydrolase protein n=1 Tax=Apiospora kogelbergensis TaxID=1337665 RepID=UPI00312FAE89